MATRATRERPQVMSTRVMEVDRRRIIALAAAEGQTVSVTLHDILVPAVRERLAALAAEPSQCGSD